MFQKTKRFIQWITPIKNKKYSGVHLIVDFWYGKKIEDSKELERILIGAAEAANNTVLNIAIHKFEPQGITGILLLAESHIAFHAWPEFDYIAIDIYTCGEATSPEKALNFLKKELCPRKTKIKKLKRGRVND